MNDSPATHSEQPRAMTSTERAHRLLDAKMAPLRKELAEIVVDRDNLLDRLRKLEAREREKATALATEFERQRRLTGEDENASEQYIKDYICTQAVAITERMEETLKKGPFDRGRENDLRLQCSKPELIAALLDANISKQLKVPRDVIVQSLVTGLVLPLAPRGLDDKVAEAVALGLLPDNLDTQKALEVLKKEVAASMSSMRKSLDKLLKKEK